MTSRFFLVLVALIVALFLFGCRGEAAPPFDTPDIEGIATDMETMETGGTRILIEEQPGVYRIPETSGRKISFSITDETHLARRLPDGSVSRIGVEDLKTGMRMHAWSTGALMESYPEQGTARYILVLPDS